MNVKKLLRAKAVRPYVSQVRIGLEKESQRATLTGDLSTSVHPQAFGARQYHPTIQTDFSETQIEMITPVFSNTSEIIDFLAALHDVTRRSLPQNEMLWPLSMPPVLPANAEDIQLAQLTDAHEVAYREHLAEKYGKRKQMVSGIHYNFEFGADFLAALFAEMETADSMTTFKNDLYLKVTRNYLRYRWLITYLFGATPSSLAHYFTEGDQQPPQPVRSLRNSSFGYRNPEGVQAAYENLASYHQRIDELIQAGLLSEEKELYTAIRLRGGETMRDVAQAGIRYVELRNLDLNPFEPLGINESTLQFLNLFMLFLLWTEEQQPAAEWVAEGERANELVALAHPLEPLSADLLAEGQRLFEELSAMVQELELTGEYEEVLTTLAAQLMAPQTTIGGLWWQKIADESQQAVAVDFGQTYQQAAWRKPYQLAGFTDMELSTQILMFDALQAGVNVAVLDRQAQFLKLSYQEHVEYVRNANMTSKDTYIAPLIMENKTVTKKVLAAAGFRVPKGDEFTSLAMAKKAYQKYRQTAFVIKPKTTNYGLGITIFKTAPTEADFEKALALAFEADQAVLIEEYLPGTEYRFFVIANKVEGIMLRVPANVTGDGQRTISELVAEKNLDPLRGTHHRAPLEKIALGAIEELMLASQGFTIDSIPPKGTTVYLRENSNISTGGDSIDMTDAFDDSYKQLAVEATKALGATICGIDLIIPDYLQPTAKAQKNYGIIEANFNPAMHMHVYPQTGQGRRLTKNVLQLLFPELLV